MCVSCWCFDYHITEHFESSCELLVLTCRATLAASVNASLTPRFRIAEHSIRNKSVKSASTHQGRAIHIPRYLKAPIRLATSRPSLY